MTEYTLAGGVEAKQRLSLLGRICRRTTLALLERVGLKQGYRCLDVGCGGGDVTIDIARIVGPSGRAVGVDFDDVVLQLARQDARAQGVENVEFRKQSAEDLDESGYDLVYSRFLLVHLGDPKKALRAMVDALDPGGVVAIEDVEYSATFCYPPNGAFERFVQWRCETLRRRGADPDIGPRLPAYLRAMGLSDIGMNIAQVPLYLREDKLFYDMSMEQIRAATLGEGVADAEEFDATHAALRALADEQATVLAMPRVWQVWGHKQ